MKAITKRLKDAIDNSKLPYEEIEERLELEGGTVELWISGRETPDTDTIKRLAPVLGVSADKILFGVERIGEMKAMFPNEATPSHTPMSDWRFLAGVIMIFVGVAGDLLMFMRYAGEGMELSVLLRVLGAPAVILAVIALVGAVLCVATCIACAAPDKKKKGKETKNEKK